MHELCWQYLMALTFGLSYGQNQHSVSSIDEWLLP
jgi:hypothetical protein